MIFQYPKTIKILNSEKHFRRAVLHWLCYRDRKADNNQRLDDHAYFVGYLIGMMVAIYIATYRRYPRDDNVNIRQMVLDEVNRLDKELNND